MHLACWCGDISQEVQGSVYGAAPLFLLPHLPTPHPVLPTSISTGLITPDGDYPSTSLTLLYYGWLSLALMSSPEPGIQTLPWL